MVIPVSALSQNPGVPRRQFCREPSLLGVCHRSVPPTGSLLIQQSEFISLCAILMPVFLLFLTPSLNQEPGEKQASYVKSQPHVADLLMARWPRAEWLVFLCHVQATCMTGLPRGISLSVMGARMPILKDRWKKQKPGRKRKRWK